MLDAAENVTMTEGSRVVGRQVHFRRLDIRAVPAYGLAEACHYLGLSDATLRSWVIGRTYSTEGGLVRWDPIIRAAGENPLRLSFTNLVEAQVLGVIRKVHGVSLDRVRAAMRYMEGQTDRPNPLANVDFCTDGRDLYWHFFDHLINASKWGQRAFPEMLAHCLRRIERDPHGLASKLYPARPNAIDAPLVVAIDPRVSFGRATLAGTGIPVAILAERNRAGETVEEIAEDYGRAVEEIAQAIEWERAA